MSCIAFQFSSIIKHEYVISISLKGNYECLFHYLPLFLYCYVCHLSIFLADQVWFTRSYVHIQHFRLRSFTDIVLLVLTLMAAILVLQRGTPTWRTHIVSCKFTKIIFSITLFFVLKTTTPV